MKDVSQYPVKYGFGITEPTPPWSATHKHLGVDRPTPMRTPLIVNGQLIGYTGNSGNVAAHHHLQKVEADGRVVDPKNDGFTIPSPATVFDVGDEPNIGKHIRIRDAQGVEWSHFHLDEILVKTGDTIGGTMNQENAARTVQRAYFFVTGIDPTPDQQKYWTGELLKDPNIMDDFLDQLYKSPTGQQFQYKARHYDADLKAAGTPVVTVNGEPYVPKG